MIGQYLPQIYENTTVTKSKKFSYLNKALFQNLVTGFLESTNPAAQG